jgi:hypothetical protein
MYKLGILLLAVVAISHAQETAPLHPIDEFHANAGFNFTAFFSGMYDGLSRNPGSSSSCTRVVGKMNSDIEKILLELKALFTNLDFTYIFDVQYSIRDAIVSLDEAVDACEFPRITNEIKNIFSTDFISSLTVTFVFNQATLISNLENIPFLIASGNSTEAGTALGQTISILLNYKI